MSNILQERATLVSITIHQWTNQTNDKRASDQVDSMNNANKAGKFIKHLVPPETMKEITAARSAIRTNHYVYTHSWGDNGERILPGRLVFEFTTKHRALKDAFDAAVEAFLVKYPYHKAQAPARLGSLYDPRDFPDVNTLRKRFGVEMDWGMVPDAKDFRIDVAEDTAKQIRAEIEESVARRQNTAIKGCWERMREVVSKIAERLSDEDAVFRDTLIENARLQVSLLGALNLNDDPEVEATRKELEGLLVPPQRLRDDKALRNAKAEEARKLLEKINGVLPT